MSRRPNIVVISAHDIGRHLGCYGVREVPTPNLDHLAGTGVRFARMFSTAPQCSPSRASYATGRYPHETGVLGICSPVFGFDLTRPEDHLARVLHQAGYETAGIGVVHETLDPARLFDSYRSPGSAEERAAEAGEAIRGRRGDSRPHYLQVGFTEAHRPFRHPPRSERGVYLPPWLADEASAHSDFAAFQGSIAVLDEAVGHILSAIDLEDQDTLVVFLSDHGMPFPRAKHSLYEPGCEVAALVRWPARNWSGGRVVDGLASGVDIAPTILEAAGVRVRGAATAEKAPWAGRSLVRCLDVGDSETERDAVYTEQTFNAYLDPSRAVRTERFKLIANFSPGRGFFDSSQEWRPGTRVRFIADSARTYHPPLELYDLRADPLEETNLADDGQFQSPRDDLAARLRGWMIATEDPLLQGLPTPPLYHRAMAGIGLTR